MPWFKFEKTVKDTTYGVYRFFGDEIEESKIMSACEEWAKSVEGGEIYGYSFRYHAETPSQEVLELIIKRQTRSIAYGCEMLDFYQSQMDILYPDHEKVKT